MSLEPSSPEKAKRNSERLRNRLNILLLASVKDPILLELKISSANPKRSVHEYDTLSGSLVWNFKQGNRLYVDVNGSGLVTLNGKSECGLDYRHKNFRIPLDTNRIDIEISESGELGSHKGLRLPVNCVVYSRDEELYSLFNLFQVAVDMARIDEKWDLVDKITDLFRSLPQLRVNPISYLVHSDVFSNVLGEGLTSFDPFLHLKEFGEIETPITSVDLRSVKDSLDAIFSELNANDESKKGPEIIPLGNAHIDLAWLWPIAETKEKIRRTFTTVTHLMKSKNFTFLQSMVSHYEIIKEMEPEVYMDIKKLVAEKKWIPVGGMIVESDCNLTGGESLVRQFLYGQQFFKSEFGECSNVAWLPDTFGYTQQLPQILTKTGFEMFVTTKFTYNDTTRFPHDLFNWEGPDGSTILAHSHMRDYISDTDLSCVKDTTDKNHETSSLIESVPLIYGYGDGGGGPTEEMIDRINFIDTARKTFYTGHSPLDYWLSKVKSHQDSLPIIRGELYLEAHRGTYTTHGDIKMMNRRLESELFVAEAIASFSVEKGQEKLNKEWKTLLRNQFHDIIPGSSIDEVYRVGVKELRDLSEHVRKDLVRERTTPLSPNSSFTIFSPYWWKTSTWVPLGEDQRGLIVVDDRGREAPVLSNGWECGFYADFDRGMGFYAYSLKEGDNMVPPLKKSSPDSLHKWTVKIESGKLSSISLDGKNLPIPQLLIFNDFPYYFDGWELDNLGMEHGHLLEQIGLRKFSEEGYGEILEIRYNLDPGILTLRLSFPLNGEFVNVHFDVDWKGYNRLLRMYFKTGEGKCIGETAFSTIERTSVGPTYEFPAHRFVAVERNRQAFVLLNDSKYGFSFKDGHLGVSLLRSPFWPDPLSDRGNNSFSFSYGYIQKGDPILYYREGVKFNIRPVLLESKEYRSGNLEAEGIVVASIKQSEDESGKILRIFNPTGERRNFTVYLPFEIRDCVETDLLERSVLKNSIRSDGIHSKKISGEINPNEIKTLRLALPQ
jgi:alpha-mannosidase